MAGGAIELPDGCLLDPKFHGMAAEAIYHRRQRRRKRHGRRSLRRLPRGSLVHEGRQEGGARRQGGAAEALQRVEDQHRAGRAGAREVQRQGLAPCRAPPLHRQPAPPEAGVGRGTPSLVRRERQARRLLVHASLASQPRNRHDSPWPLHGRTPRRRSPDRLVRFHEHG
jgi:hypothetical protein